MRTQKSLPFVVLFVELFSLAIAFGEESAEELVAINNKSHTKSRNELRSGEGRGYRTAVNERGELLEEITFHAHFVADRFHIDMVFDPTAIRTPQYNRRILLSDGSKIFANWFSPRINPDGCEVHAFNADEEGLQDAAGGFSHWIPDLVGFKPEFLNRKELTVRRIEQGRIQATFPTSFGAFQSMEFDPSMGNNLVAWQAKYANQSEPSTRYQYTWKKKKDVWYIEHLIADEKAPDDTRVRRVFHYDSFEPNVTVPKDLFTFKTLELCNMGRLIEHRRNNLPRFYDLSVLKTDPALNDAPSAVLQRSPQLPQP